MAQETFPDRKMDNVRPYNPWSLTRFSKKYFRTWLIRELSKVEGGLDGITLTEVK